MPNTSFTAKTGQLTAASPLLILTVAGYGTVGFTIGGSFSGTVSFEGRVGGAWVALAVATPALPGTLVTIATAPGTWRGDCGAMKEVRLNFSTPSSGVVGADITASGVGA